MFLFLSFAKTGQGFRLRTSTRTHSVPQVIFERRIKEIRSQKVFDTARSGAARLRTQSSLFHPLRDDQVYSEWRELPVHLITHLQCH